MLSIWFLLLSCAVIADMTSENYEAVGKPTSYSFRFLSSEVAKVYWTAPNNFVAAFLTDHYIVQLNDLQVAKVPGDSKDLTVTLIELPLCESLAVTISSMRNNSQSSSVKFIIRNWDNESLAAEVIESYPEAITECRVCPSEDMKNFCVFPFEHNGVFYDTCTPFNGPGTLNCKDKHGTQLSCYIANDCLPELPVMNNLRMETIIDSYSVNLFWFVNSDAFTLFQVFVNGELLDTTIEAELTVSDLVDGNNYEIQVVMNSFGRNDDKEFLSFTFRYFVDTITQTPPTSIAGKSPYHVPAARGPGLGQPLSVPVVETQQRSSFTFFAHNITNSSTELSWDNIRQHEDPVSSSASKLECRVQPDNFVQLFLGAEVNEVRTFHVSGDSNSLVVQDVNPGMPFRCEISIEDGKKTLATIAPIVPNSLDKIKNNLSLNLDHETGTLTMKGKLSNHTGAESLNTEAEAIKNNLVIIQDDGFALIAKVDIKQTSFPKVSCQTVNCVSESLEFSQVVIDEKPEAGTIVKVKSYGNTGPAEAKPVELSFAQAPNPVEHLMAYSVDETSVKVSWQAPLSGYLHHFRVVHVTQGGPETTKEITGGYLKYTASNLVPGSTHLFRVFSVADKEGEVVSVPNEITVDTAPKRPSGLTLRLQSALEEPRKVSLSFQPPDSGLFEKFKVNVFEIDEDGDVLENTGVLQGSVASQFLLDNSTFESDLNLLKFGSVYKVELRSQSKNGRDSFFSDIGLIMTGTEFVDLEIHDILLDKNHSCFVWDTTESRIAEFSALVCSIEQLDTSISTSKEIEAGKVPGLICLNVSTLDVHLPSTRKLSLSKQHKATGFSVFTPPLVSEFQEFEEKTFDLDITTSSCDDNFCNLTLTDDKLAKRSHFNFDFELFRGDSREFETSGVFLGSDCDDLSESCHFVVERLNSTAPYTITISVVLSGEKLPISFTQQISNTGNSQNDGNLGAAKIAAAVIGAFLVLALAVIALGILAAAVLYLTNLFRRSNGIAANS